MKVVMKCIKVLFILILLFVLFEINMQVYAVDTDYFKNEDTISKVHDDIETNRIITKVLKYLRIIGIVFAVIMIAVIGLKYIFSSLNEKATYKENAILYIVGCLLIVSACILPDLIYNAINTEQATESTNPLYMQKFLSDSELSQLNDNDLLALGNFYKPLKDNDETYREYYEKIEKELQKRDLYVF